MRILFLNNVYSSSSSTRTADVDGGAGVAGRAGHVAAGAVCLGAGEMNVGARDVELGAACDCEVLGNYDRDRLYVCSGDAWIQQANVHILRIRTVICMQRARAPYIATA